MKLRSLAASTLLLASVLAGAPGAVATPTAAPATAAVTAPSDDQSGTDGIDRGTREWACRVLNIWCR